MPTPSKVDEVVDALRDEEARLMEELAAANERVREIKSEVARIQKGIKTLSASGGGVRKGRKRRKRSETASPTADSSPSVVAGPSESETSESFAQEHEATETVA